ncbi:hypothetical protein BD769DRAFT_1571326 [Suillus cothurnatus]|nr:hypothetical protein BD769DRAFT_1571326 [Suillus cothurnatus]
MIRFQSWSEHPPGTGPLRLGRIHCVRHNFILLCVVIFLLDINLLFPWIHRSNIFVPLRSEPQELLVYLSSLCRRDSIICRPLHYCVLRLRSISYRSARHCHCSYTRILARIRSKH